MLALFKDARNVSYSDIDLTEASDESPIVVNECYTQGGVSRANCRTFLMFCGRTSVVQRVLSMWHACSAVGAKEGVMASIWRLLGSVIWLEQQPCDENLWQQCGIAEGAQMSLLMGRWALVGAQARPGKAQLRRSEGARL